MRHQWDKGSALVTEEVEAVAVGLQLLNRTGDRDLQAAARRVAAKVAAVLPELRDDFRHFRADRIVACHETGDGFADLAPQLRRDWRVERGMPRQDQEVRRIQVR